MKKLIFICIALMLLISSVTAIINVTTEEITSTSIKWAWNNGIVLSNLSVDGYKVLLVDKSSNNFVLSGLEANETHTIKIMSNTDYGSLSTTTNTQTSNSGDSILSILWIYSFAILASIFIILGLYEPYFSFIGFVFACLGVVQYNNNSIYLNSIYGILIVLSLLVAFRRTD